MSTAETPLICLHVLPIAGSVCPFSLFPHSRMTTATLDQAIAETETNTGNKKPVQVFRHRAISASVFENTNKKGGTFHSVSLQRTYKVDDEFKHSSSFTRDDVPVARQLLQQAWEYVLATEASRKAEDAE